MCTLVSDALGIDLEAIRGDDLLAELLENIPSLDNAFTSSVIVQVEEELLIFIGTENGLLLKVQLLKFCGLNTGIHKMIYPF